MMVKTTQALCPASGAGENRDWNIRAEKLRTGFIFLNNWRGEKSEYFMTRGNDMKFKLKCSSIKFYWHMATPTVSIGSLAAFGLLRQSPVVMTETIWSAKPKTFTICLFIEKVCCPLG